jgi:hypothetical protein
VLLRIVALGISDDWIAGDAGLHGGDQSAALLQLLFADPVGQEAELADAHQTGREHVKQKAADELGRDHGARSKLLVESSGLVVNGYPYMPDFLAIRQLRPYGTALVRPALGVGQGF